MFTSVICTQLICMHQIKSEWRTSYWNTNAMWFALPMRGGGQKWRYILLLLDGYPNDRDSKLQSNFITLTRLNQPISRVLEVSQSINFCEIQWQQFTVRCLISLYSMLKLDILTVYKTPLDTCLIYYDITGQIYSHPFLIW